MDRRGFLHGMLALGAAPAIVKAANLMPLWVRSESGLLVSNGLLTPSLITSEALRVLEANLFFGQRWYRTDIIQMEKLYPRPLVINRIFTG